MALATVAIVGMPPSCINSTAVEGTITIAALLRFRPSLSMFIARKRKAVGLSAYILAAALNDSATCRPESPTACPCGII